MEGGHNFEAVTPLPVTGPVCHIFGHLKKHLADKRFITGAEVEQAVTS
jgi:hypothetical protein